MITVFNRRELIVTMDMKRQSDIRNILCDNHIDYVVKTTNLQRASGVGSGRSLAGSFGINQDYSCEYKIFVHKNDYGKAENLIKSSRICGSTC